MFIVYTALTIYVWIGIGFEERKLLREFGQAYADYKFHMPMLIPALSRTVAQRGNSAGTNDFDGSS